MDTCFIGVDIGGTKTSVSLGTGKGELLSKQVFPTVGEPQQVLQQILSLMRKYQKSAEGTVVAGGISCGGPLEVKEGLILSPPHLPLWDRIPICEILSKSTGIPLYLENDANACALAEWFWGNGKGTQNMVFLTFGTGLGAGIILNGKLYQGTNGQAGEIGHIRVADDGPLCYGKRGSAESFCCGAGISLLYKEAYGVDLSAKDICNLAEKGEEKASRVIKMSAQKLGLILSCIIDFLNPERIIIGSIYSRSEKLFKTTVEEILQSETLELNRKVCSLFPSGLGENIGDYAALGVAKVNYENK